MNTSTDYITSMKPVGNHHVERKYDDNITLIRPVKQAVIPLAKDEYYARMIIDPNGGLKDEKGLEKSIGQVMISKQFNAIHLYCNTYQTYLVRVNNKNLCWISQ